MSNLSNYLKEIVIAVLVLIVIAFIVDGIHIIPFIIPFMKQPEAIPLYVILIFEGYMTLVSALWIFDPLATINEASNPPKKSPWPLFFVMIAIVLVGDFFNQTLTSLIHFIVVIIGMAIVGEQKRKYDGKKAAQELFKRTFRATYDEQKIREGFEKAKQEGKEITKEEMRAIFENARYAKNTNNPKGINDYMVKPQPTTKKENFVLRCAKCNSRLDPASKYCPTCKEVIDESNIMVSRIKM